jgi:hypothetical protein
MTLWARAERASVRFFIDAFAAFAIVSCPAFAGAPGRSSAIDWPPITAECRPATYWWWMGSAVNEADLTQHLEAYQQAGIGGVHVIPIYGVRGLEDQYVPFLGERWMALLKHTAREAERLGMFVDMSTGTGWPFGGPNVRLTGASAGVILKKHDVAVGGTLALSVDRAKLAALMAFSAAGDRVDLADRVGEDGKVEWTPTAGSWTVYHLSLKRPVQSVKRAAPGGEGPVVDPFSPESLRRYLERFEAAFDGYDGPALRGQYHDSYEYYGADWTPRLFDAFEKRCGYDLREELAALFGAGPAERVARVKSDYRRTMAELHLAFIETWVGWCHGHGWITRNQAHGAPANILDTYAAADIPETEVFQKRWYPLVCKFASSAAHVAGRKRCSSESCTWLNDHFKATLAEVKPLIDQLFVAGINHVFYHGATYSPAREPWPGWRFYAATNFNPTNSWWRDLPAVNAYVARCQSVLQAGRPANDLLVYYPIYDVWHSADGMLIPLGLDLAVHGEHFADAAQLLWDRGYAFDYVSDRLLGGARVGADGALRVGDGQYRALVVPRCRFMPVETMRCVLGLVDGGATVLVQGSLPTDVPGWADYESRRRELAALVARVAFDETSHAGVWQAKHGRGRILRAEDLELMLDAAGVRREALVDGGLEYIRRRDGAGHWYYIVNFSDEPVRGWTPLAVDARCAAIFDPLSDDRTGMAATRRTDDGHLDVYLDLAPGESCIVRALNERPEGVRPWRYVEPGAVTSGGEPVSAVRLDGDWSVEFISGGPELPTSYTTSDLEPWTARDDPAYRNFAGTARYTIRFDKPADAADEWILSLGRVCDSAQVRVNGEPVATLFAPPFRVFVGRFLRSGENVLEVDVTNVTANRIADMDRRGVEWKRFHDINFVHNTYKPFDASGWTVREAGLIGPVRLVPATVPDHTDLVRRAARQ